MELKLHGLETQQVTAEREEKRYEKEREQLQKQIEHLETELKSKTSEIQTVHKEQCEKSVELQSQLNIKTDQVSQLEEKLQSLEEANSDLSQKVETYINSLKQSRDEKRQMEVKYGSQLQAQSKLLDLYKTTSEESEKKCKELTSAAEEQERLLSESKAVQAEQETQLNTVHQKYGEEIKNKEKYITEMQKELQQSREQIEKAKKQGTLALSEDEVEKLAPIAAATSRLLKSGKTLTQIYTEYVEVSEELHKQRQENKNLNFYMNQILKDIEEKAPVLNKQKTELEEARRTNSRYFQQLETATQRISQLENDVDIHKKNQEKSDHERQNMKQKIQDLNLQVKTLLTEMGQTQDSAESSAAAGPDASPAERESPDGVTGKFTPFRNIEELQDQNQTLQEEVRELSCKRTQEDEKSAAAQLLATKLQQQLDVAVEELDQLRVTTKQQATMMESLERQRNLLNVQLSMAKKPAKGTAAGNRGPPGGKSGNHSPEVQAALQELQKDFNTYRTEKGNNEKMLNDQINRLRQNVSELQLTNGKLKSQLQHTEDRFKLLQSSTESQKKEITVLRSNNQRYMEASCKSEAAITMFTKELKQVKELKTRAEVQCENLQAEKAILSRSNCFMEQENERLKQEQKSQHILLQNVKAMQNNLERSEFEAKAKLTNKLEAAEKELESLQRHLDDSLKQNKSMIAVLESQIAELKKEKETSKQREIALRKNLEEQVKNVTQLKDELSRVESQLAAAEVRLANIADIQKEMQAHQESPAERIKELQAQLQQADLQTQDMKSQVERAHGQTAQYKELAEGSEKKLQEYLQEKRQQEEELESNLRESNEEKRHLKCLVDDLEKEKQELKNEITKRTEECEQQNADLKLKVSELSNTVTQAEERVKTAVENEKTAREDNKVQVNIAIQAKEKYERELMLHAKDVKELTSVNDQLQEMETRLKTEQEKYKSSEQEWTNSQMKLKEQEKHLQDRVIELGKSRTELEAHNAQLLQELESLTERSQTGAAAAGDSEKSDTSGPLMGVLKFERRGKAIAEAKYEMLQAESDRQRLQISQLEEELNQVKRQHQEEQDRSRVKLLAAAEQTELTRKAENLDVLSDSNRLLRKEIQQLAEQVSALQTGAKEDANKLVSFEDTIKEKEVNIQKLKAEKLVIQKEVDQLKTLTDQLKQRTVDPEKHKLLIKERDELSKQSKALNLDLSKLKDEVDKTKQALISAHQEREQLKKQVTSLYDTTTKQKAALAKATQSTSSAQDETDQLKKQFTILMEENTEQRNEISSLKEDLTKANNEAETLKKSLEEKSSENETNSKKMIQLRNIARKYKSKTEETEKELEELKSSKAQDTSQQLTAKVQELEQQLKDSQKEVQEKEEKNKKLSESMDSLSEQLGSAVMEKAESLRQQKEEQEKEHKEKIQVYENKCKDHETKITEQGAKIAEQGSRLAEQDAKIKVLEGKVSENQGKITEQVSKVTQQEGKDAEQEGKLSDQTGKITEQESKIAEQESKIKEKESRIAAQENEIKDKESKIAEQESKMKEQENKAAEQENKMKEQENKAAEQENKMKEKESKIAEQVNKIKDQESKIAEQGTKITEQGSRMSEQEGKITEQESKITEQGNQIIDLEQQMTELKEKTKLITEELEKARGEQMKLQEKYNTQEKNQTQLRSLVQKAKARISSYKDEVAQLTAQITALKQGLPEGTEPPQTSSKPQHDLQKEQELTETKQSLTAKEQQVEQLRLQVTSLSQEREELQARVSLLERAIESHQQKARPAAQGAKQTVTAVPVERKSPSMAETPKTASIRPMASPTAQPLPAAPRVAQRSGSAEATALVRPLAVATASSVSSSQTPTATVMPTSLSAQEGTETSNVSAAQTDSRPTQEVQPMSPHTQQDTSTAITLEPSTSHSGGQAPTSHSGGQAPTSHSGGQAPKRQREEDGSGAASEDHGQLKRSRVQATPQDTAVTLADTATGQPQELIPVQPSEGSDHSSLRQEVAPHTDPDQTTSVAQQHTSHVQATGETEASEPSSQISSQSDSSSSQSESQDGGTIDVTSPDEESKPVTIEILPSQSQPLDDNDDIILVEDDVKEEPTNISQRVQMEIEESSSDDNSGYEVGEEEYPADVGDPDEGYPVGDVEDIRPDTDAGDEDIVILDDEPDEPQVAVSVQGISTQPSDFPQTGVSAAEVDVTAQRQQTSLVRAPGLSDSRTQASSRAHLTPFTLGPQGPSPFEEGDDGIVPSTPTLFVPRRTDGFAEAVSSPQVAHGNFFSDLSSMNHPELGLSSQTVMRLDDTRMDLSQLNEGSVRSGGPSVIPGTQSPDPDRQAPSTSGVTVPVIQISQADSEESNTGTDAVSEEPVAVPSTEQTTPNSSTQGEPRRESAAETATASTSSPVRQTSQAPERRRHIQPIVWSSPPNSGTPTAPQTAGGGAIRGQGHPGHRGQGQTARRSTGTARRSRRGRRGAWQPR